MNPHQIFKASALYSGRIPKTLRGALHWGHQTFLCGLYDLWQPSTAVKNIFYAKFQLSTSLFYQKCAIFANKENLLRKIAIIFKCFPPGWLFFSGSTLGALHWGGKIKPLGARDKNCACRKPGLCGAHMSFVCLETMCEACLWHPLFKSGLFSQPGLINVEIAPKKFVLQSSMLLCHR